MYSTYKVNAASRTTILSTPILLRRLLAARVKVMRSIYKQYRPYLSPCLRLTCKKPQSSNNKTNNPILLQEIKDTTSRKQQKHQSKASKSLQELDRTREIQKVQESQESQNIQYKQEGTKVQESQRKGKTNLNLRINKLRLKHEIEVAKHKKEQLQRLKRILERARCSENQQILLSINLDTAMQVKKLEYALRSAGSFFKDLFTNR